MNADDLAFGAPDAPNTEETAELANALPPTLEEVYAEGRKDERKGVVQQCIDIVALHGGSVEIEAAMRALIDGGLE